MVMDTLLEELLDLKEDLLLQILLYGSCGIIRVEDGETRVATLEELQAHGP